MEKVIDENKQGERLVLEQKNTNTKKLFIESYGCAMNFSDSEIVASILNEQGYNTTQVLEEADLVLVNTCSIRDKAEQTIRKRLEKYNAVKRDVNPKMKVGVLGCMAERLKEQFLEQEKIVDLVVGPDAYKDLPNLLAEVEDGRDAINVILSKEETYGDISPVRLNSNGVTAFVSITRGCDNMCTFCVVPFTRGRERSREPQSIIQEIQDLWDKGFKEVCLLGQNVDSYLWYGGGLKKDFVKASEMEKATSVDFAQLLEMCAIAFPKMRFRFSTSNPQDMHEEVLHVIANHHNVCNYVHLPVQSGSTRILKEMNRQHTREEYMTLVDKIKAIIPNVTISQDLIAGFPTETEEDHKDTLSLMEYVQYDFGYMFSYSERPGTLAARKLEDDVPEVVKKRRLQEIVDLQQKISETRTKRFVGEVVEVLIEKASKKSDQEWSGKNSENMVTVFPKENYKVGEFVLVKIKDCTGATLKGEAVGYSEVMN
ncbi:tRNA (N6-isopentenyl adenosine(37)-C2)-methylthiotransferase MiaB [uncultured Flavobacterium sp.]|uniref:tRNA (N6-isopentenyl adenosine(37)-C2)-methylthiotransferase MiaB n=1 Tax=uncultured Flavobacterium sp. TaxID=165435 RepID=UPI0030EC31F3|tara:strand:+ start:56139 stop:57590 length:1452 start_codon:yes stop_codon:yes gene_type:complete